MQLGRSAAERLVSVVLVAVTLMLTPTVNAHGAHAWCASSGVLPSDASIPERDRFELVDEASFASLNGSVMEIDDTVDPLRINFLKQDVEFPPDSDWAFQAEVRMISHARQSLDFGVSIAMVDGSRAAQFGVARGTIGFIDSPSTQWIDNAFVAMDTTDAVHVYRVVKTGAGGDAIVEVFVDDGETPVLTVPYENLWPNSGTRVVLAATSIVGTARFDVRCFAFNTQGTDLTPCDADVDGNGDVGFGDLVAVLAAWGEPGGPADIDGNGSVDFGDVIALLAAWGPCT